MFTNLKKQLYFEKLQLLFNKGLKDGSIVPFDEEFYDAMSHTYIFDIPVSMEIKYLRPTMKPGKCYDRSLYMFFCFDDALLVRGDNKDLELKYGKDDAGHGWIEIGNYVYDPSLLLKFDKELFYEMYSPTNVVKYNKEDYIKENKDFYDEIKNTTLQDFRPNGKRRLELGMFIPLIRGIVENSNDTEFEKDFANYLDAISYDEKQIYEEMDREFKQSIEEKMKRMRK